MELLLGPASADWGLELALPRQLNHSSTRWIGQPLCGRILIYLDEFEMSVGYCPMGLKINADLCTSAAVGDYFQTRQCHHSTCVCTRLPRQAF